MVLEFAKVRILSNFTKDQFMAQSRNVVENFIKKQKGFIEHNSYWTEQEEWVDIIKWETLEDAKNASAKIESSDICMKWMSMMDPENVEMYHLLPTKN